MSRIENPDPCPPGAPRREIDAASRVPAKIPPSLVACLQDPVFVFLNFADREKPAAQIRHTYGVALDAARTKERDHAADRRA